MRPEVAAFRELDSLVRNLTEQLAGYRRRALTAEARARDLEERVSELSSATEGIRKELDVALDARDQALTAVRDATAGLKSATAEIGRLQSAAAARAAAAENAVPAAPEVLAENEMLRNRVAEAKTRAAQLSDRVRFLRQQIAQGVEK